MTQSELTVYILAFIGLVSCILFGTVWICIGLRVTWLYANYSAGKAIRAHKFAVRTRARTKSFLKEMGY